MTENRCRYDKATDAYLTDDGEPCDTPKRDHCSARRTCSQHLAWGELTCGRCLLRSRNDVRQIVERSALMLPEALTAGVNSEAANMAGPAADYRVFSARRIINKRWIMDHIHKPARGWCDNPDCTRRHFKNDDGDRWHKRGLENALADLIDDDDEWHPYSVLTRWHLMLAEDYGLPLPDRMSIADSAAFLDRILHRVANDEEQDFGLLSRELKKCRTHLESVLSDSLAPERGVPCPTCKEAGTFVRLTREYSHWCEDPDCEQQFHPQTDDFDTWVCPRDPEHWWTAAGYAEYLQERRGA